MGAGDLVSPGLAAVSDCALSVRVSWARWERPAGTWLPQHRVCLRPPRGGCHAKPPGLQKRSSSIRLELLLHLPQASTCCCLCCAPLTPKQTHRCDQRGASCGSPHCMFVLRAARAGRGTEPVAGARPHGRAVHERSHTRRIHRQPRNRHAGTALWHCPRAGGGVGWGAG